LSNTLRGTVMTNDAFSAADLMRKHRMKARDESAVGEELMATEQQPRLVPPTPEELARRKAAVDRILATRQIMPSIAPRTTADLVHMSRDDNFWYGEEEPKAHGTGG